MKLKLKNTPEQVELIKAMGSRDMAVANEASQAFAAFVGPVVREVRAGGAPGPWRSRSALFDLGCRLRSPERLPDVFYRRQSSRSAARSLWLANIPR